MVVAIDRLLAETSELNGSIGLLITSDEEGDAIDGTVKVSRLPAAHGTHIDYCIVGEPSSNRRVGDMVRVGRRGSLNGRARIRGIQGHVAYPEKVRNPIHLAAPAMAELATRRWDDGNDYFPATTFQISNVHGGTGATNVVPGSLELLFNFRFNTEQTPERLQATVAEVFARHRTRRGRDLDTLGPAVSHQTRPSGRRRVREHSSGDRRRPGTLDRRRNVRRTLHRADRRRGDRSRRRQRDHPLRSTSVWRWPTSRRWSISTPGAYAGC